MSIMKANIINHDNVKASIDMSEKVNNNINDEYLSRTKLDI